MLSLVGHHVRVQERQVRAQGHQVREQERQVRVILVKVVVMEG